MNDSNWQTRERKRKDVGFRSGDTEDLPHGWHSDTNPSDATDKLREQSDY